MTATFIMRPVPPFRLDFTAWALRRLPTNEMDRWDGATYRRVLTMENRQVEAAVSQNGRMHSPELHVQLDCDVTSARAATDGLVSRTRRTLTAMLGLDVDLSPFYRIASTDPRLEQMVNRFRGLKPPRFPSVFEGLVNGVACQQLSLNVGIGLLNRLSTIYGRACGESHAFPLPEDLAPVEPEVLRSLGFSTRKAENIVALARAVDSRELTLEKLEELDDPGAVEELDRLEGVGRWTAEYVALRGLGRLDVFPADDVGSQNKIQQWLSLDRRPGYEEINRRIAAFRPYRGLIYFHLLLNHLAERGSLTAAGWEG